ncbi:hypothetical protein [Mesorhizobium sp. M8A.F.Ca.ET.021.01.1.1]|uniref:hypothetical protein n=1 Tax=Mesorhizobium sp. M8A.F.Ca.ET.021.01.1.1 TaxID=2496757 RepID=UPI000FCAADE8|nr:hypothetical protein [Mesorhizobium sp. M8A.F.Ca.ET.021.01.1.1]RUW56831.1 hypothetical protein EOA36_02205 [Mesorhizobium sp. M8A.F.Ca.ET.021.01.1.1]
MTDEIKPTMRAGSYRRKRDGAIVTAGDWPDGDVSWMILNPPVISFSRIVGTCSAKTFEKTHVVVS